MMSIATTFGTATTGTAISALSGAAAQKAAYAWLGRTFAGFAVKQGAGMAAGQPHDAGRTARASPGSPLMGSAHLPRSSSQRHRLGALLRLPDPRTARLTHR